MHTVANKFAAACDPAHPAHPPAQPPAAARRPRQPVPMSGDEDDEWDEEDDEWDEEDDDDLPAAARGQQRGRSPAAGGRNGPAQRPRVAAAAAAAAAGGGPARRPPYAFRPVIDHGPFLCPFTMSCLTI